MIISSIDRPNDLDRCEGEMRREGSWSREQRVEFLPITGIISRNDYFSSYYDVEFLLFR